MRMRMEFDLDSEAFDEERFSQITNEYLTIIDAADSNWYRLDEPVETVDPDAGVLSPGNSAYTTAEGGEVNGPVQALAAQQQAAEAGLERAGEAESEIHEELAEQAAEQTEPEPATVETPAEPTTKAADSPMTE